MGLTDDQEVNIDYIGLAVGGISFICSILTLVLIYFTRKWNGYLLLLTTMTCCQILYDINYILRPSKPAFVCYVTQFCDLVGGLGVSFWTNILAFVIAYTVVLSQSINIFALYPYFSIFATIFPISLGILSLTMPDVVDHGDDGLYGSCGYYRSMTGDFIFNFYYYARVFSAIVTVLLCALTSARIKQMAINTNANHHSKDTNESTNESRAILRTVKKMNFYAVAQVVCRSGAAWNEFQYYEYSSYGSGIMAAICSPSTGIFNFLIFLFMQPNAWRNFKYLLRCKIPPRVRNSTNPVEDRQNLTTDAFFRDKFISQADYDHHGIMNSLHQGNVAGLGPLQSYFYPDNNSLASRPTSAGGSFIELGRQTTIGTTFRGSTGVAINNPIQPTNPSSPAPPPQHLKRPASVRSAYDFFDEDGDESGGYSNSFLHARRSTWDRRDSDSFVPTESSSQPSQSTGTFHNSSLAKTTLSDIDETSEVESDI